MISVSIVCQKRYSVVCVSGIGVTHSNIHFFKYIQAYKPYADTVPHNTMQYQFVLTQYHQIVMPFFLVRKWALLAKNDQKKWHFEWPNQNSKTTFIVQTFPKNGPYGFDLVNLSLLGAILAKFQFCSFSGLFWPIFPCT